MSGRYVVTLSSGEERCDKRLVFASVDHGCLLLRARDPDPNVAVSGPIDILAPGEWRRCRWEPEK